MLQNIGKPSSTSYIGRPLCAKLLEDWESIVHKMEDTIKSNAIDMTGPPSDKVLALETRITILSSRILDYEHHLHSLSKQLQCMGMYKRDEESVHTDYGPAVIITFPVFLLASEMTINDEIMWLKIFFDHRLFCPSDPSPKYGLDFTSLYPKPLVFCPDADTTGSHPIDPGSYVKYRAECFAGAIVRGVKTMSITILEYDDSRPLTSSYPSYHLAPPSFDGLMTRFIEKHSNIIFSYSAALPSPRDWINVRRDDVDTFWAAVDDIFMPAPACADESSLTSTPLNHQHTSTHINLPPHINPSPSPT
jgi:hypothetical protein